MTLETCDALKRDESRAYPSKKLPFTAGKDSIAFQKEVILALIKESDARAMEDIPATNRYVFQHGREWNFQQQSKDVHRIKIGDARALVANGCKFIRHDCEECDYWVEAYFRRVAALVEGRSELRQR